jgi:hypothetical protein
MRARSRRGLGSIEERNGSYYLRRSQIATDGNRQQWRLGPFPTRAEAEAARQQGVGLMPPDQVKGTWGGWFDVWLPEITAELESQGRSAYAAVLERYVRLYFRPNLAGPMSSTTPDDLSSLWAKLQAEGLADRYVANLRFGLNKAAAAAKEAGLLEVNPVTASELVPREGGAGARDPDQITD